jgi:hypothetical protein
MPPVSFGDQWFYLAMLLRIKARVSAMPNLITVPESCFIVTWITERLVTATSTIGAPWPTAAAIFCVIVRTSAGAACHLAILLWRDGLSS